MRPVTRLSVAVLLYFCLAATPTVLTQETRELGMRLLLITSNTKADVSQEAWAKLTLESVGARYDVLHLTSGGSLQVTGSLSSVYPLVESDGTPRYMGIILGATSMTYSDASGTTIGPALTTAQWSEIDNYCSTHGIRRVDLFSYPQFEYGVEAPSATFDNAADLTWTTTAKTLAPHLNHTSMIPIRENYVVGATHTGSVPHTTVFGFNGHSTISGSAILQWKGYEVYQQYHTGHEYDLGSILVGPVWLNWLTRGIYLGRKRVVLDSHIDDTFLRSIMFDPATGKQDQAATYRITYEEMEHTAKWTRDTAKRLPRGSYLLLLHAYNGFGIEIHGGPQNDKLYKSAIDFMADFYWVSHTFTHLNLDKVTYEEATFETVENQKIADTLLFDTPERRVHFSENSMVTPQISGLFNGRALRALRNHGIHSVVGDNSVPELIPDNLYHGIHTKESVHGADGIFIIPRFATEVFFDCKDPDQNVAQYNHVWGTSLTYRELMDQEAARVVRFLMMFRHDGYMFHQANLHWLRYQNKEFTSLITFWHDRVLDLYLNHSKLPVTSQNIDPAHDLFLMREAYDACDAQARLVLSRASAEAAWQVIAVKLSRAEGKSCKVPITGVRIGASPASDLLTESNYGGDFQVIADLTNTSSITVPFSEPVVTHAGDLMWRTYSSPFLAKVTGLSGADVFLYTKYDNPMKIKTFRSDGVARVVGGDEFVVTMTLLDSDATANSTTQRPGRPGQLLAAYYRDRTKTNEGPYTTLLEDHVASSLSTGASYSRLLQQQQQPGNGDNKDDDNKDTNNGKDDKKDSKGLSFEYSIDDPNTGEYTVYFRADTVGLYSLDLYLGGAKVEGSPFRVLLKGRPPFITKVVATDPGNNVNYANGDVIEVHWDVATNAPEVNSKDKLDRLFEFSESLGDDYTGRWSKDSKVLFITVVDDQNASPPRVGNFTIRPIGQAPDQITKARLIEESYPATTLSPAMIGDFGQGCKSCLLWLAIGLGVGIPIFLILVCLVIRWCRNRGSEVGVDDQYDPEAGERVYLKQIRTGGLTEIDFYGNKQHADFTSVHF